MMAVKNTLGRLRTTSLFRVRSPHPLSPPHRYPQTRHTQLRHQSRSNGASGGTGIATEGASVEPPPPGGHLPSIATSSLLRTTRDRALRTPGIKWVDEHEDYRGGEHAVSAVGGREARKMNLYQSVRDALR